MSFRFENFWVWVSIGNEPTGKSNIWSSESPVKKTFLFRVFSVSSEGRKKLTRIIEKAREEFGKKYSEKIFVYLVTADNMYGRVLVPRVSEDSVILDCGIKERLFDDIRNFYDKKSFYRSTGIPYRRGYMFYGPPGSGKSSIVTAIASKFNLDILIVSVSGPNVDDEKLLRQLACAPHGTLILLEDIDSLFPDREKEIEKFRDLSGIDDMTNNSKKSQVTFSGLLNALDGVASQQGRIVIYTSNYPERLDAALMRPGRIDVKFKFDYATKFQMRLLFLKFYPNEFTLADSFSEDIESEKITMAELQKYLLESKDALTASSKVVPYFKELEKIDKEIKEGNIEWKNRLFKAKEESEFRTELRMWERNQKISKIIKETENNEKESQK